MRTHTQIDIEKFLYNQGKYIISDIKVLDVNVNYLNINLIFPLTNYYIKLNYIKIKLYININLFYYNKIKINKIFYYIFNFFLYFFLISFIIF